MTIGQIKRVRKNMKNDERYRKSLMRAGAPIKDSKKKKGK